MEFNKEKELREWIIKNIDILGESLKIIDKEYPIENGRIDLLCTDENNIPLVIEFKKGEVTRKTLGQILSYRANYYIKHKVIPRMMIIAKAIPNELKVACNLSGIDVRTYKEKETKTIEIVRFFEKMDLIDLIKIKEEVLKMKPEYGEKLEDEIIANNIAIRCYKCKKDLTDFDYSGKQAFVYRGAIYCEKHCPIPFADAIHWLGYDYNMTPPIRLLTQIKFWTDFIRNIKSECIELKINNPIFKPLPI